MPNLEELSLNLDISARTSFVDGNDLRNLVDHMALLKRFTLNIQSRIDWNKQVALPSNASILKTFANWKFNPLVSWMDSFPATRRAQCHIHSSSYRWKQYYNITNQFPGGLFQSVREISLFDERPFEHEFFLRIAQSFPLLESLRVINETPQKNKHCEEIEGDNHYLSIAQYPHLIDLDLHEVHDDYVEQFLLHTRTFLPNNVRILAEGQALEKVTGYYQRDATRINCSKISCIFFADELPSSEHFEDYFLNVRVRP